jgi:hypothetical protein
MAAIIFVMAASFAARNADSSGLATSAAVALRERGRSAAPLDTRVCVERETSRHQPKKKSYSIRARGESGRTPEITFFFRARRFLFGVKKREARRSVLSTPEEKLAVDHDEAKGATTTWTAYWLSGQRMTQHGADAKALSEPIAASPFDLF